MKLGLSTYSFPWAFGVPAMGYPPRLKLPDLLRFAHEQGIARVQVGDNCPLHQLSELELQQLLDLANESGIQLEVGTRGLKVHHLDAYLQFAKRFKSPFLRVVIDDQGYHPTEEQVVGVIREVLPAFVAAGTVLAIENHDRFPSKILRNIIGHTDPAWVGICLDTANSLGANEGLQSVVDHLAPYTVNLHLKDIRIQRWPHLMGFQVEGCPAGQGVLNCPELLDQLKKYPSCHSVTLELWSSPLANKEATLANERQWVMDSLNYLKTLL